MNQPMHTTKSAAEYLQRRYAFKVQPQTIKQWCNRGLLPRAQHIGEGRRGTWQIPQEDLNNLMLRRGIDDLEDVHLYPKWTERDGDRDLNIDS